MPLQIQGNAGVTAEVESSSRAQRTVSWPQDPSTLGFYMLGLDNGTTAMSAALAANSPIFSFRWGNANLCLLRRIEMSAGPTTAFVAGRFSFDAFFARSFTASDTSGTAATLTGNNMKKRTSMGTTLVTDIRIASTTTLTAGTRTLDAQPFAKIYGVTNTLTTLGNFVGPNQILWKRDAADEYPLVFAQNEGFVIQATVPGTGVWFFGVNIEWMEIAAF
jgi:hypothetical protein